MKKIKMGFGVAVFWGAILEGIDVIKKSQVVHNPHIIQDISLDIIIACIGIAIFIWGLRSKKRIEF